MLLVNFFIAKSLPMDKAGDVLYYLTLAVVFSTVVLMGYPNVLIREVASSHDVEKPRLVFLESLCVMSLAVLSLVSFSLVLFSFYDEGFLSDFLFLMLLGVPFYSFVLLVSYYFRGAGLSLNAALFQNVLVQFVFLVFVVLDFFCLEANFRVGRYSAYFLFSCIVVFFVSAFVFNNRYGISPTVGAIRWGNFSSAINFWLVQIMQLTVAWFSVVASGFFLNSSDVAELSVIVRIASIVNFIVITVGFVTAPRFARFSNDSNTASLFKTLVFGNRLIWAAVFPYFMLVFIFAEEVLLLFGEGYVSGAAGLRIMLVGQLCLALAGPGGYLLMMGGGERVMKTITFFSALTMVVFCLVLMQFYGVLGAACAVFLSMLVNALLSVFWVKREFGVYSFSVY